jgi:Na+-transporting NADH:ubiquinone oxidoreductase subunit F
VIEVALGVALFTGLIMGLVCLILLVRARLLPSGSVRVVVNGQRTLELPRGETLLRALGEHEIYLPSACGGKGTCAQCKLTLLEGGGPALPTETAQLSRGEVAEGVRLAGQLTIRDPLRIEVAPEVFGVRRWTCRVRSSRCVATLIKEIVLELPELSEGEEVELPPGGYVQVTCPPYQLRYADLPLDDAVRDEWDRLDLWRLEAGTRVPTTRAYSLANYPAERGIVTLVVRIATPPPGAPEGTPPGVVSSWLYGLAPGDAALVSGPYGHFFVQDSEREMIFVGGGAGMAPLRSHLFDQLEVRKTRRTTSFWYGARSLRELFYVEDFDRLAREHENFRWTVALSEPREEDRWNGEVGFIHEVLLRRYLADHPAPEDCEYYLCGPPLMIQAVRSMLDGLGVEPSSIFYDDFG